jgi:hypothetical protein
MGLRRLPHLGLHMIVKVGFSSHKGNFLSEVIRWFTHSKISHAWLYIKNDDGSEVLLEAVGVGVRETPWAWFPSAGTKLVALVNPVVPLDVGVTQAKQWVGEKYDRLGLVGMALVIMARWFKAKLKNPLRNSRELWCSELVGRVLQLSNYPGMEGWDPAGMSPEDVYEVMTHSST